MNGTDAFLVLNAKMAFLAAKYDSKFRIGKKWNKNVRVIEC